MLFLPQEASHVEEAKEKVEEDARPHFLHAHVDSAIFVLSACLAALNTAIDGAYAPLFRFTTVTRCRFSTMKMLLPQKQMPCRGNIYARPHMLDAARSPPRVEDATIRLQRKKQCDGLQPYQ